MLKEVRRLTNTRLFKLLMVVFSIVKRKLSCQRAYFMYIFDYIHKYVCVHMYDPQRQYISMGLKLQKPKLKK